MEAIDRSWTCKCQNSANTGASYAIEDFVQRLLNISSQIVQFSGQKQSPYPASIQAESNAAKILDLSPVWDELFKILALNAARPLLFVIINVVV
jgi:hypothetical protein